MLKEHTAPSELDVIEKPQTATIFDRYLFCQPYIQGKKVLDAGCGEGMSTMVLHALGAKSIKGVDINYDAIMTAGLRYGQGPHYGFHNMGITSAPFPESHFDTVVSLEVIEHIPLENLPETFRAFKRFCKDGGKIIISTPNIYSYHGLTKKIPEGKHDWGYHWSKTREMIAEHWDNFETYGILEKEATVKMGDKTYKHMCSFLIDEIDMENVPLGLEVVFFIIINTKGE